MHVLYQETFIGKYVNEIWVISIHFESRPINIMTIKVKWEKHQASSLSF